MPTTNNSSSNLFGEQKGIGTDKPPAKILIVDDEESVRDLFKDILDEEGYEVWTAGDGNEAIEKIAGQCFDLIISDMKMPGMDGLELLQKCKAIGPEIEVIIITGYASVETAITAMKLGAADYLTKPLNIDLIKIIVTKALEKRELQKAAKKAEYYKELSRLDSMTALFNHQALHHLLEAEVARAERQGHSLSLLMVDIDDFKQYNDTYGHPAGDLVLNNMANLLKRSCRFYDLIARYGGEEFCIIAPETSKPEAILLGNRLVEIVGKTSFPGIEGKSKSIITISIGIATFPEDAPDKRSLIMQADQALYQAKFSGKNKLCIA